VLSRLSSTVRPLVNAAKRFALVLALSFGPQIIALKGPSPAFLPVFSLTYRSRCLPWLHNLPRLRVGDVLVDFCSSEQIVEGVLTMLLPWSSGWLGRITSSAAGAS
jgi:hypothetical protein